MVMMMNEIETFTLMALASEIRKAMKKKKRQTQPQTQAAVTYAHFSLTYFCSSICFFFRYSFLRSPAVTVSNDYARFGMLLHYEIGWVFVCYLLSCVRLVSLLEKSHIWGNTSEREIHSGCVLRLWNDTAFHSSTKAIRIEKCAS